MFQWLKNMTVISVRMQVNRIECGEVFWTWVWALFADYEVLEWKAK